jgi:choice-of-anchor A domain-containing protein
MPEDGRNPANAPQFKDSDWQANCCHTNEMFKMTAIPQKALSVLAFLLSASCAVCHADSAPFGVASAYDLVALGYAGIPGNIGTSSEVEGRIAAANLVTQPTTIEDDLRGDPYGALANGYGLVAGTGVTAGGFINLDGFGNIYAPSNNTHYNFNDGGQLFTSSLHNLPASSPINFALLAVALDAQSLQLATLAQNGVVGAPTPPGGNPSWFVLSGVSPTLNVFTVTAAEFASVNNPLDINVPAGSTVIINVEGANVTLGTAIYFNGQEETDADAANILFNFAGASSVAIDGQLDGAVLAPFAILSGTSQMGGNFIAAEIGQTGEVHNDPFTGKLPPAETPEPETLTLMCTGVLALAGVVRRRLRG